MPRSCWASVTLEMVDLPPGERAILSLQAPEGTLIVFDPVTHAAQFIEVKGEETGERQNLSVIFNKVQVPVDTVALRPGPLRLALENRTDGRVLPAVWVANAALDAILTRRKPVLTATRLLTNQTFRDIYRTDTLAIGQRLKILSLTFLFSDLRGSTELYERVGDLTAFDLVNEHFRLLQEIIASERGAVVKTIGDAVMATFETPDRAIAAAIRMREAMSDLGAERQHQSLSLKMGIHEGSCLAVTLNAPAGLFWPDGEHRLARPGPCGVTLDRGDGIGGGERESPVPARDQGADANTQKRGVERHCGQGVGLRDILTHDWQHGEAAMNKPVPVNPPELRSTFVAASSMPWQPTDFDGIEMKILYKDDEGRSTILFKMAPGAVVPLHEHTALEQTFMLEGSLEDAEGSCGAGDFVWRPGGNIHVAHSPNGATFISVFNRPNRFFDGTKFFTADERTARVGRQRVARMRAR